MQQRLAWCMYPDCSWGGWIGLMFQNYSCCWAVGVKLHEGKTNIDVLQSTSRDLDRKTKATLAKHEFTSSLPFLQILLPGCDGITHLLSTKLENMLCCMHHTQACTFVETEFSCWGKTQKEHPGNFSSCALFTMKATALHTFVWKKKIPDINATTAVQLIWKWLRAESACSHVEMQIPQKPARARERLVWHVLLTEL